MSCGIVVEFSRVGTAGAALSLAEPMQQGRSPSSSAIGSILRPSVWSAHQAACITLSVLVLHLFEARNGQRTATP